MYTRKLAIGACALFSLSLSSLTQADSFDDAVNLYLKGFDHCVEARNAVGANNAQKARSEFSRYKNILNQAKAIDGSIMNSSRREMDSNLKFCERVQHDLEIIIGTPMIEEAFDACEQTYAAIEQKNLEQAQAYHQQFIDLKDKAVSAAPSLKSVFSITSQIRRCERAERKISRLNSSQNLAALTKSVQEDVDNFSTYCQKALQETTQSSLNYAAVTSANSTLKTAKALEKGVVQDLDELKQESSDNATNKALSDKLASGQQCLAKLSTAVAKKESAMVAAEATLQGYASQLAEAAKSCNAIGKIPSNNQAAYQQAKSSYESARATRTSVQRKLSQDSLYNSVAGPSNANIKQQLATLNRCLAGTERQLKQLVVTAPRKAPTPVASVPVKAKATPASKSSKPAARASVSLQMEGLTPEWVLAYWEEKDARIESVDVDLLQSGFGKPMYIATPNTKLKLRSSDFSNNQVFAEISHLDFSERLARLRYRQRSNVSVEWEPNTVAVLKTDQERIAPSYVATVTSDDYAQGAFTDDAQSLTLNIDNPGQGKTGYILMPGYEPIKFTIGLGEEAQYDVKNNDAIAGRVTIKGQ